MSIKCDSEHCDTDTMNVSIMSMMLSVVKLNAVMLSVVAPKDNVVIIFFLFIVFASRDIN